jgi:amino-acid N-acetyltransferase
LQGDNELFDTVPRPAQSDDLAAFLALLQSAELPTSGVSDSFPASYTVVRRGEAVIAGAGLEIYGAHGLLRSLAVTSSERARGLGRQLVDDRLSEAERRNLDAVYLLTTTAADYFRRLGFTDTPREAVPPELQACAEFASICPASATCLVKRLANTE